MSAVLIAFIREQYRTKERIPLHAPTFGGKEREYVERSIETTFVSSVGEFVNRFESGLARYTGAGRATATVNGTAALHLALVLAGVKPNDVVVTQPLTFIATCNAIRQCGATPALVDVDQSTMGLSATALEEWLSARARVGADGLTRVRETEQVVRACVPVHTFGHPVALEPLLEVCRRWRLAVVEDAAESLGSMYHGQHTGTFGLLGSLSFNGNKIITTGGGGMVLSDTATGVRAKHLSTTARRPHAYEYVHDEAGFNYRLPALNAALGCAQFEQLDGFVAAKRRLAGRYAEFMSGSDLHFVREPDGCRSNYWLNTVLCEDRDHRDALLRETNEAGIMTRPAWQLMHRTPPYADCLRGELTTAEWLADRILNLPSSVPPEPSA